MIPTAFVPLANHLWQSTLFAAVVGLPTLALRRNQARIRYWLWLAASYKFLLPFSWLVSIGHLFQLRAAPAVVPHALSSATQVVSSPIFLMPVETSRPVPNHLPAVLLVTWAVWACGFVAIAVGWARGWLRIRAVAKAALPLPLGLPIRAVSLPARLEPGVVGIFRPLLLLPEGIFERLTQAQLQAVMAHEMCHVRRRDNLTAAVHMLVEALFWPYPLVWWLGARLMEERERACDEEVLRLGGEPEAYAQGILNVCKSYIESPVACVSGISGSDLKKRIVRIMTHRPAKRLTLSKKVLLSAVGMAAMAAPLATALAQSHTVPQWQIDAGGKMKFDVASVKPNKSSDRPTSNFNLHSEAFYADNGGLFSAKNMPLITYIMFAYKMSGSQIQYLAPWRVPKWVMDDRFDIEARSSIGDPTKDQMRLMMQSLLADRFKLAIHTETRQLRAFALVLVKPGKTGPQLQPDNSPCSSQKQTRPIVLPQHPISAPSSTSDVQLPPMPCGGIAPFIGASAPGRARTGGRLVTLGEIASELDNRPLEVDRPLLDRTRLNGTFDFSLEWSPNLAGAIPPPNETNFQPDPSGPTFQEALKEQLGLKLKPTTGPVDVFVVDHVEEPSAN